MKLSSGISEGYAMRSAHLSLPELGLIAGTRAALGAGLALLLSDRLTSSERYMLGWTLTAVGLATTIPLAADVLSKSQSCQSSGSRFDYSRTPEYAG